ncbi:MAG: sensor histidine kinase, partial [Candidatus Zixiibacteriota bacterium]
KFPEKVNLRQVVDILLDENKMRISEENVQVIVSGPQDVQIRSNQSQFRMAMNNILLNSLDAFKEQKKPQISIAWQRTEHHILLTFKDNGKGIESENLSRIFEPFFSTKTEMGGTGLGLAMTKRVIEIYDGEIQVSSSPQNGTTFEIKLQEHLA